MRHPCLVSRNYKVILTGAAVLSGLYISSLYNYLLFHSLAEMFSVGVALGIFMLAWNSRKFMQNSSILFLGIAYLFVGSMYLLHTLAYPGMGVFRDYDSDLPTQLWIAARYMESISLLAAPALFGRRLRYRLVVGIYALAFTLLGASIFLGVFPVCFVEGEGLTAFKKASEYIVSLVMAGAVWLFFRRREEFDEGVLRLLVSAIILTIGSELAFTLYTSAYSLWNLVGHFLKIISFYLVYKAIIVTGLVRPYDLLFRELKQSEAEYRSLFENMFDGFAYGQVVLDRENRPADFLFLSVNDAFERLTGLKRAEVPGKKLSEALPVLMESGFDWIGVLGGIALKGGEGKFEHYFSALRRWYSVSAYSPERGRLVTLFQDITDRKHTEAELEDYREMLESLVTERTAELVKINRDLEEEITGHRQAEQMLRESEERYRKLMETANDAILITDTETGVILEANRKAGEMTGLPAEEIVGMHFTELHPKDEAERHRENFRNVMRDGYLLVGDITVRHREGRRIPVELSASLVEFEGKKVLQGIIRDVTARKKMEEEILKAQKLESVGILAGGIAHDFNNILSAIMNNIYRVKMSLPPGGRAFERLEAAEAASLRARNLTQLLLAFSRGGAPVRKETSIGKLTREMVDFSLSGFGITCRYSIPRGLWPVKADEGQIGQVISNLIINACQAMDGRGTIKVSAENVGIGAGDALPLREGKYVRLTIQDEGHGIPAEHLDRIFDPYYTTKEEGSGLGLASTYFIVRKHDGCIDVRSEEGVGTAFNVYLPAMPEKAPELKKRAAPGYGDGKRVLVMDDDMDIRESVGAVLKFMGYEAHFASDGGEAVDLYKRAGESDAPFDAVIMDLTVPGGMGGVEAVKRLRSMNPSVRAIVSSGYNADPVMADFEKYGFDAVIAKPYRIDELMRVLYRVISEETGKTASDYC